MISRIITRLAVLHHIGTWAMVVLVASSAFAQVNTPVTSDPMAEQVAQGMIVKALTAQRIGRIDNAITYAQSASMVLKEDPEVLSLLSALHQENGDTETSLYFARQAMAMSPDSRFAVNVARLSIEQQQFNEAETILNRLISTDPSVAEYRYLRAVVFDKQGQPKRAIADVNAIVTKLERTGVAPKDAIDLCNRLADACAVRFGHDWIAAEPDNLEARLALIGSLNAAGRSSESDEQIADALRLAPNNTVLQGLSASRSGDNPSIQSVAGQTSANASTDTLRTLLTTYPLDLHRINRAILFLEARSKSTQASGAELDLLVTSYLRTGRVSDALRVGAPALDADVTSPIRWALVTETQRRLGLLRQSELTCSDGLLFFPTSVDLLIECALSALESRSASAEQYLVDARRYADVSPPLEPVEARLQSVLAVTHAVSGRRSEATDLITSALRISPDPFVLIQAGRVHQILNNEPEAIGFADRAISVDSTSDEVQFQAGRIYFLFEMYQKARASLEYASQQQQNNLELFSMLGDCASEMGDMSAARNAYEKAIALDPTNSAIKNKLDGLQK